MLHVQQPYSVCWCCFRSGEMCPFKVNAENRIRVQKKKQGVVNKRAALAQWINLMLDHVSGLSFNHDVNRHDINQRNARLRHSAEIVGKVNSWSIRHGWFSFVFAPLSLIYPSITSQMSQWRQKGQKDSRFGGGKNDTLIWCAVFDRFAAVALHFQHFLIR